MKTIVVSIDNGANEYEIAVDQYGDAERNFECPVCKMANAANMDDSGIWYCESCEASGECDHSDTRVETFEHDTLRNGEHDTYETRGYVCNWCGSVIDGDPDEDAHDAMVDAQIDEMREQQ